MVQHNKTTLETTPMIIKTMRRLGQLKLKNAMSVLDINDTTGMITGREDDIRGIVREYNYLESVIVPTSRNALKLAEK